MRYITSQIPNPGFRGFKNGTHSLDQAPQAEKFFHQYHKHFRYKIVQRQQHQ